MTTKPTIESLIHTIKTLPVAEYKLGGQTTKYVQLDSVLGWVEELENTLVSSKETITEVKEAIDLFRNIFEAQPPATLGGWNWPQLAEQAASISAKLSTQALTLYRAEYPKV